MTADDWSTWVSIHVPEAGDASKIAALAHGLLMVGIMVQGPVVLIQNEQMRIAEINEKSADVVAAWIALESALRAHPTFGVDIRLAMQREGAQTDQAGRYAHALRSVVNQYRLPMAMPPKGGRPRLLHVDVLVQAVDRLREVIEVSESRAAAIIAEAARHVGVDIAGESLRQTVRNRRA